MKKINKDTIVTLASNILPGIIALATFPLLIKNLGDELFGFFMVAWTSIGISSLLDLGIGRTISHYCAKTDLEAKSDLANSAFTILLCIALSIGFISTIIWYIYPNTSNNFSPEPYCATIFLIASLPLAILTTGLRGSIEGQEKFNTAASLRILTSLIFIIIPSLYSIINKDFKSISMSFFFSRIIVFIIYLVAEKKVCGIIEIKKILEPKKIFIREIYSYAGWLSISTLIGSTLGYMDRITLSLFSPLNEVAHYTAPFEAISRALIIPGAISTTLFPKLSRNDNNLKTINIYIKESYRNCLLLILPPAVIIFLYANEILSVWLGDEFSNNSTFILKILTFGLIFNALAHIPLASLQATGHTKVAAKIHIIEFIPSAILFVILVKYFGAIGAALAWSTRSIFDFTLLNYYLNKFTRRIKI